MSYVHLNAELVVTDIRGALAELFTMHVLTALPSRQGL